MPELRQLAKTVPFPSFPPINGIPETVQAHLSERRARAELLDSRISATRWSVLRLIAVVTQVFFSLVCFTFVTDLLIPLPGMLSTLFSVSTSYHSMWIVRFARGISNFLSLIFRDWVYTPDFRRWLSELERMRFRAYFGYPSSSEITAYIFGHWYGACLMASILVGGVNYLYGFYDRYRRDLPMTVTSAKNLTMNGECIGVCLLICLPYFAYVDNVQRENVQSLLWQLSDHNSMVAEWRARTQCVGQRTDLLPTEMHVDTLRTVVAVWVEQFSSRWGSFHAQDISGVFAQVYLIPDEEGNPRYTE